MYRVFFILAFAMLSGCAVSQAPSPIPDAEITQLLVSKEQRRLYLLNGREVVRSYPVDLGFTPDGHKTVEGDGRTPEGLYWINRRNPNSEYHLSLGISYPNATDVAQARARGVSPGGDIFIHGQKTPFQRGRTDDWTWGCIAVKNREIEQIYSMVRLGTPITIDP